MEPEHPYDLINLINIPFSKYFHYFQGLSRDRDGLLISEVDLNLCRQVKDFWTFRMTQRLPLYVESFKKAADPNFKPQIIREQ